MTPRRVQLILQILLFLLATLLGVASGYLTNSGNRIPLLHWFQRTSLPLAGIATLTIVILMIMQHRQEERSGRPIWSSGRSPFPGLESFTEADAGVFFGRDNEISELVELLHPVLPDRARRFIVVTGPSGVGKTSLVQAGLLPRLTSRHGRWLIVPSAVPGDAPMANLARSLASALSDADWHNIESELSANASGLARFAELLRGECHMQSSSVLIVIDQAEELVTSAQPHERDLFLKMVNDSLCADRKLWIIATIRSEFLTGFLSGENSQLFRSPLTVGALSQAQLIETIERPAAAAGMRFDPPALASVMAQETGSGMGLPLLAYILRELYLRAGREKIITTIGYRALGGVAGALTRQADKVTAELGQASLGEQVLPTLLKFVTFTDGSPARRKVSHSQLDYAGQLITEAFVRARLIVSDARGADATLEVAHEALFQHWAPLRQEIEAHAEELRAQADLERWSLDWTRSGRQQSYLLQGERLRRAARWTNEPGGVSASWPLVEEFLDASRRADHTTMEKLSDSIARAALAIIESDPLYGLLLALTAVQECADTPVARRALMASLCASRVRAVFPGGNNFMWRVAWSRDGSQLAASSSDRTAIVWDVGTGTKICGLNGHEGDVYSLAWAPDGERLATSSADGTARIWDIGRGKELFLLRGHEKAVRDIAWSADGKKIATASEDRTARIWDANDGAEQRVLLGHAGPVGGIAWSPDDARLASSSADRTCRIWDAGSGAELLVLEGHVGTVGAVRWSPDGQRVATAASDYTARIWAGDGGTELLVLHGHTGWVRDVAWSADGKYVATASDDTTARVWDTTYGFQTEVLRNGRAGVRGVDWAPRGRRLATSSTDGRARISDIGADMEMLILREDPSTFWDADWSPDGGRIATVQTDCLCVWDAEHGARLLCLRPQIGQLLSVAWSPDGRSVAASSADGTSAIWNSQKGNLIRHLVGHRDSVRSIAWSPDGGRLATASADHTARIWNVRDGQELLVLEGHTGPLRGVAWQPSGQKLATGSTDRTARVWDATDGKMLALLQGHDGTLQGLHWSPSGDRIATASVDRTVRLWNAYDGAALGLLLGHEDTIRAVKWSPAGDRLATASYDKTVRIWDSASMTESAAVGVHAHRVECLSWSPDGHQIVAGAQDRTARVWRASITTEHLINLAQKRVFRTLTAPERRDLLLPGA